MQLPEWNNKRKKRQMHATMTIKTLEHQAIKRKWPLKSGKVIMWALRFPHLIALRELSSYVERGNWDEYQQTQRVEKWS